ncbi:MAG: hypothetical protein WDM78_24285 [Puia sp.]
MSVIWKDVQLPCADENQLHAAVVELVTQENAEIKYSNRAELVSGR